MRRRDDEFEMEDFPQPVVEPVDPFIVDLQITGPAASDILTGAWNGVTVAVTGTVSVASGTGVIERVEVALDGGFEPATATAPGWAQWSHSKLIESARSLPIAARVIGAGGTVLAERAITVTTVLPPKPEPDTPPVPDPLPPQVTIASPRAGAAIVVDALGRAEVEVTATILVAGEAAVTAEFLVDGALVHAEPSAPRTVTRKLQLPGLGRHRLAVKAVDSNNQAQEATVEVTVVPEPITPPVFERLLLVEKCRLITVAGSFGAGQVVKIVTLAPGERAKFVVKSYRRTSETANEASSILDSVNTDSQTDFQDTLEQENSTKKAAAEMLGVNAEAQANATWGVVSASVKAGVTASSNASREELAKNVVNAVRKHADKASSKREIEIKTTREMKTEVGEEFAGESEIQNINMSRTLNLVYRQTIQELFTCLVLDNVRLAYVRGDFNEKGEVVPRYTEVALSQMDALLRQVIVPEECDRVRSEVISALSRVHDHEDVPHAMIEEHTLRDAGGEPLPNGTYLRVPPRKTSTYCEPASGSEFTVPGVILAVTKNVMRTDGILCDAFLGQGNALDDYSRGLQNATVEAKRLENRREQAAIDSEYLGLQLVEAGDAEKARILRDLRPAPEAESLALVSAPSVNGAKE